MSCAACVRWARLNQSLLALSPLLSSASAMLPIGFLAPSVDVARALIGALLLADGVGGRIVKTEAYDVNAPASHSHGGLMQRNAAMFGPPAHVNVYRSYGHRGCLNLVCREPGNGAGVLNRALQPTVGQAVMRQRRGGVDDRLLCAGPGRVEQAVGISSAQDGLPVDRPPFASQPAPEVPEVLGGLRVGISKAMTTPWRFGQRGSPFLSRRFA